MDNDQQQQQYHSDLIAASNYRCTLQRRVLRQWRNTTKSIKSGKQRLYPLVFYTWIEKTRADVKKRIKLKAVQAYATRKLLLSTILKWKLRAIKSCEIDNQKISYLLLSRLMRVWYKNIRYQISSQRLATTSFYQKKLLKRTFRHLQNRISTKKRILLQFNSVIKTHVLRLTLYKLQSKKSLIPFLKRWKFATVEKKSRTVKGRVAEDFYRRLIFRRLANFTKNQQTKTRNTRIARQHASRSLYQKTFRNLVNAVAFKKLLLHSITLFQQRRGIKALRKNVKERRVYYHGMNEVFRFNSFKRTILYLSQNVKSAHNVQTSIADIKNRRIYKTKQLVLTGWKERVVTKTIARLFRNSCNRHMIRYRLRMAVKNWNNGEWLYQKRLNDVRNTRARVFYTNVIRSKAFYRLKRHCKARIMYYAQTRKALCHWKTSKCKQYFETLKLYVAHRKEKLGRKTLAFDLHRSILLQTGVSMLKKAATKIISERLQAVCEAEALITKQRWKVVARCARHWRMVVALRRRRRQGLSFSTNSHNTCRRRHCRRLDQEEAVSTVVSRSSLLPAPRKAMLVDKKSEKVVFSSTTSSTDRKIPRRPLEVLLPEAFSYTPSKLVEYYLKADQTNARSSTSSSLKNNDSETLVDDTKYYYPRRRLSPRTMCEEESARYDLACYTRTDDGIQQQPRVKTDDAKVTNYTDLVESKENFERKDKSNSSSTFKENDTSIDNSNDIKFISIDHGNNDNTDTAAVKNIDTNETQRRDSVESDYSSTQNGTIDSEEVLKGVGNVSTVETQERSTLCDSNNGATVEIIIDNDSETLDNTPSDKERDDDLLLLSSSKDSKATSSSFDNATDDKKLSISELKDETKTRKLSLSEIRSRLLYWKKLKENDFIDASSSKQELKEQMKEEVLQLSAQLKSSRNYNK